MPDRDFLIFAPQETYGYAARVAEHLGRKPDDLEEFDFEDGEMKLRPKRDVGGMVAYVIQSLYAEPGCDAHRKMMRLLFLAFGLRDLGVSQVHAVVPYLAYARQDRRDARSDPLTHRYFAELFEASRARSLVTLDVHNPAAFQNAHRCITRNIEMDGPFSEFLGNELRSERVTVVSPDAGGIRRAKGLANQLGKQQAQEIPLAVADKTRSVEGVTVRRLLGGVGSGTVLLYDDMISTGSTIYQAACLCKEAGARQVIAVATHGIFCGNAVGYLEGPAVDRIVVSDSVARVRAISPVFESKISVVSSAQIVAEAIRMQRSAK